jgi:hypothetical protein
MFLFMYSDCTNYCRSSYDHYNFPMCLVIFYVFSYRMDLYFLCSILAVDIFIILFALFIWITKGISPLT